ncbi:type IV pilus modification protein PilV [Aromatoleum anaerobium]|uniref:Type IV pilus modification protein PilV n=1 Tax=Aromatoleum anaerobium TaxID=182180 RepID=A0ABX1PMQ4_9RHOO|nr:type IV pilus modification protein PilV [Aromatoleum anaerobium]MCK0506285.1 type IV pilus modification protein PilV [Aromatoleum anaerobium]
MKAPSIVPLATRAVARVCAPQRGATLIEVLVAVVVLSIGLLGLAGLQMTSLQSNHSAYMRSQASLLAYDLSDRMRANCEGVRGDAYADGSSGDRADWDASVVQLLGPGAQGTLELNGQDATIAIQWNDNRGHIKTGGDSTSDSTKTFAYRTEPCADR